MIALRLTRGFSAGNWQILLTNNNLNVAADWQQWFRTSRQVS
jgi:hypothetical protein